MSTILSSSILHYIFLHCTSKRRIPHSDILDQFREHHLLSIVFDGDRLYPLSSEEP